MEYISPAPAVFQSQAPAVSVAPAPVDECIAPAPAVIEAPASVVEYIAPAPALYAAPAPVEYIAPAPAVVVAPALVVEYITHAPAVFAAPAPVDKYIAPAPAVYAALAPVVEHNTPVPAVYEAPAPVMEFLAPVEDFIAPSTRTQFFSLSHQRLQMQRHFPAVTGTKSRRGIETPTSSLSRRRLVDEAGHVLDVQVERVMRASVARLGYEWRRTKKREKQLAETLLHLSHELQSCPSHGHTVTLLGMLAGGRGPLPAPSAIAGVVSRVGSLERSVEFHEDAILELGGDGPVACAA